MRVFQHKVLYHTLNPLYRLVSLMLQWRWLIQHKKRSAAEEVVAKISATELVFVSLLFVSIGVDSGCVTQVSDEPALGRVFCCQTNAILHFMFP
jgi:hypothetical protein